MSVLLAVDVRYSEWQAIAAGVLFRDWTDDVPARELVSVLEPPAAYEPGEFYRRELPCILQLLEEHHLQPQAILIDGFVYLDGYRRPGLGRYFFDALGGTVAVIGIAKSAFSGIGPQFAVYRGTSRRPLFVTAAGVGPDEAKELVSSMHGEFRIPTLLKRVDRLTRVKG
jgi:deoxyribonuclease V